MLVQLIKKLAFLTAREQRLPAREARRPETRRAPGRTLFDSNNFSTALPNEKHFMR